MLYYVHSKEIDPNYTLRNRKKRKGFVSYRIHLGENDMSKVETLIGNSFGTMAPGARVPINTPLAIMQRDLNRKKVEEYAVKSGGVDWNLFGYATAVRFPDGHLELINGQHRIEVVKEILPDVTEVPAHIIDITDAQYAAILFDYMNGGASASLKSEEQFFAKIHAGDKHSLQLETVLKKSPFSVGKVNFAAGVRGIKYANFVKSVKFGETGFLQACDIINTNWPTGKVSDNLISGLSRLFGLSEYKDIGDPGTRIGRDFRAWIKGLADAGITQKQLEFRNLRNAGPWYDACAYGVARQFLKNQRRQNKASVKIETIKHIWELPTTEDSDSDFGNFF